MRELSIDPGKPEGPDPSAGSRPEPFRLGAWRVEPLLHRLERDPFEGNGSSSASGNGAGPAASDGDGNNADGSRHLTPKAMEVLVALASRGGGAATRQELLDAVWPSTHVGEEVLTRAISDLRAALGDDRRQPRYIETIPKVGYRLVAEVEPVTPHPVRGPRAEGRERGADRPPWKSRRGGVRLGTGLLVGSALLVLAWSSWNGMPQPPASETWAAPPLADSPAGAPLAAAPLTAFPGFESDAEISPDGTRVAFVRSASDGSEADLYILPSAGGEARRLTEGPAAEAGPTWSPDGRRLAFQRYLDDGCSIFEISAQGGPERLLGSCGVNVTGDLAWSPSGEWLAFSDRETPESPMGIFLLSTLTGERHKLVAPDGEHWGDHTPSFSPDGRQLAFVRSVSHGTQDVYRISLLDPGASPLPVTRDAASIRGHAWLPDGSGLVVSSRRTGARGLWRVTLDGTPPRWIPLPSGHAWYPTLARRTGQLIFEDRVLESTLKGLSLGSGAESAPWLPSTREDLMPAHSPDGRRIAFSSNRSGPFEIWVADADGSSPQQVTALAGAFNGSPRWTPDGANLVFDARLDGQADVYRVAPGSAPVRLTRSPANDLAPSVSPDGRFLYFGSNRSGRWQIWRLAWEDPNPEAVAVTRDGGYRALPASNGESLYLTRYGQRGLFRHSLASGTTEALAGTGDLLGPEQWTVAGSTLYFLTRERGGGPAPVRLYRLRPPSEPELVADLGRRRMRPGLSIAPGAEADPGTETLLYAELTRLEADLWRMEGVEAFNQP